MIQKVKKQKQKGGGGAVDGGGGGVVDGGGAVGGGGAVDGGSSSSGSDSSSSSNPLKTFHVPNFQFFSMIAPYILIGFFFLLSFFNTNLKGVVYLIGLIVLLFVSGILGTLMPDKQEGKSAVCGMFENRLSIGGSLPFGLLVYGFTISYLFFPMIQTSMMNYPLIIGLLMLIGVDVSFLTMSKCSSINNILISIAISIVFGFVWYLCVQGISPSLLYHVDYLSDKQVCSMPSQQKFKCSVYKNGELITTTTK